MKTATATEYILAPEYKKAIEYDRETQDYAMYLDGELIGFAPNYHAAETTLDAAVYEMLRHAPRPAAPVAPVQVAADPGDYDDLPTDAPGGDCGDHGPYGPEEDDCPKCAAAALVNLWNTDRPQWKQMVAGMSDRDLIAPARGVAAMLNAQGEMIVSPTEIVALWRMYTGLA